MPSLSSWTIASAYISDNKAVVYMFEARARNPCDTTRAKVPEDGGIANSGPLAHCS